jgi:hypothetical protein
MKKHTVSVVGLWRDSQDHIERTLKCLEDIEGDADFSYYFYENDSTDGTKNRLKDWLSSRKGELLSETVGLPKFGSVMEIKRLMLLACYRNKCASQLKDVDTQYTLMIDTDIEFTKKDFLALLSKMTELDCVMTVANTRQPQVKDLVTHLSEDSFYDVGCLKDKYFNRGTFFADCPLLLKEDIEDWYAGNPVKISSGFSGFSLVKTEALKKCKWSTNGEIEHVNLCSELREFGDIYIIRECQPKSYFDESVIDVSPFPEIAQNELRRIQQTDRVINGCLGNTSDLLKFFTDPDNN